MVIPLVFENGYAEEKTSSPDHHSGAIMRHCIVMYLALYYDILFFSASGIWQAYRLACCVFTIKNPDTIWVLRAAGVLELVVLLQRWADGVEREGQRPGQVGRPRVARRRRGLEGNQGDLESSRCSSDGRGGTIQHYWGSPCRLCFSGRHGTARGGGGSWTASWSSWTATAASRSPPGVDGGPDTKAAGTFWWGALPCTKPDHKSAS